MGTVGTAIEAVCFCRLIGLGLLRVGDKVLSPDFEEFAFLEIVDCPKITLLRVFWYCRAFGFEFAPFYVERCWQKMFSTISEFISAGVIRMSKSILPNRTEQSSRKPMMEDSMSPMHW